MQDRTPAQLYALIVGATLVVAGIIGFFYSASFGSPGKVDAVLGILDVNAWHNIVHVATGALGLLALTYGINGTRAYALGLGVVYVAVAAWGFILGSGHSILGIVPVNTEDNFLHAILGVLGLAAYAATKAVRDARTATTAPAAGA